MILLIGQTTLINVSGASISSLAIIDNAWSTEGIDNRKLNSRRTNFPACKGIFWKMKGALLKCFCRFGLHVIHELVAMLLLWHVGWGKVAIPTFHSLCGFVYTLGRHFEICRRISFTKFMRNFSTMIETECVSIPFSMTLCFKSTLHGRIMLKWGDCSQLLSVDHITFEYSTQLFNYHKFFCLLL